MKTPVMLVLALLIAFGAGIAHSAEITLPADKSTLRESTLPGYAIAQQKCGICHSADYISYQAPDMNLEQWTAEMVKMQHSYGAPISEDEIKLIGAYLAVSYGSAKIDDPDVVAVSALADKSVPESSGESQIDVEALLAGNACMSCHAIETKVVGPSFKDVHAKYDSVENASAVLAASIQAGGSGKWGQIPMPPMSGLSAEQALALAEFILSQ